MKKYTPGLIISLIFLILLVLVDWKVYSSVMPLTLPIVLLSLHVIVYKHLIPNKKRLRYFMFSSLLILSVYLSLPKVTHTQAKEKVLNNHSINIVEMSTVPIHRSWNPFVSTRAYFFKGYDSKSEEEISLMVSPNTGKILVLD